MPPLDLSACLQDMYALLFPCHHPTDSSVDSAPSVTNSEQVCFGFLTIEICMLVTSQNVHSQATTIFIGGSNGSLISSAGFFKW